MFGWNINPMASEKHSLRKKLDKLNIYAKIDKKQLEGKFMQKRIIQLLSLMVAMLMLALAGCTPAESPSGTDGDNDINDNGSQSSDDDIVVGVLLPTSGSEAFYGQDMLRSYELAVSEINAAGGVLGRNIRLFQADDGCDANMASKAAARIIAQGVDFVIGGYCSGNNIPALQQFYDADLLTLISCSTSAEFS
jgi:branched-chain amino acid transport system substrate-binding protein